MEYIIYFKKMKPKPSVNFVLLGTLLSGPKHGYEMIQFIDSHLENVWHISNSQLYVLLKRLENDRLVTARMEHQESRPSKRVFDLTDTGKKLLLNWLHSPVLHVREFRMEFIAKLFFFHYFSINGSKGLIDRQIHYFEQIREKVRFHTLSEKRPFDRLVFEFKADHMTHLVDWLSNSAKPFFNRI
ncbi:MAG: PadR family transcriptional regulator [Deltaproteobacteria bacterium]|nr:PadR family transcriptional regulator [Deltaproteobacteria bacterium]